MNKEEILAASRNENQNKDMVEKEALRMGNRVGNIAAASLALVFFAAQVIVGKGMNYALWALVLSMSCAIFWVKYVKMRKKHELLMAILYTVLTLALSVMHIYELIAG